MPHKQKRNARAPVGAPPDPLNLHHTSRHKKAKRSLPRLDESSSIYTDGPAPKISSPKRGEGHASSSTSNDDDADGDISNADGAEPDDESDEDEKSDAFAPSDRAIEEHADQAGHVNGDVPHHESKFDRKPSNTSTAFQDKTEVVKAITTVGDSDDDVYNRVDLISDSEEDEPRVEHMEERNIIESEETDGLNNVSANFEASDGWEGLDLDDGLFEEYPFFDEQYGRTDSNILDGESELFQSASIADEAPLPSPSSSPPRRVRFKELVSQSSNDTDMDSDSRNINALSSPDATPIVPARDQDLSGQCLDHEGDNGSPVGNSSGYETDYGDTTDEEDVPASAIKRPQSLLRQPSLSSLAFGAQLPATPKAKGPSSIPGTAARYRRGPRLGTWTVNVLKPRAAVCSTAKSIAATANPSPSISQQALATLPDPNSTDPSGFSAKGSMYEYNDPVLGPGSDIVAASAPQSTGHRRQPPMAHSFTPPSVFLPMDAMADDGSFVDDNYLNDDDDDDDGDDDALLNIDDFIDFGDDSSEDGNQAAGNDYTLTSPVTAEAPSPVQLKTPSPDATMASEGLMKHLDKHIVSAFRRGQSHHQPQSRPRHGNLALNSYALKNKRQAAASAPMGPQRKRKMSGSLSHRPPFGGPAAKKRKIHHR